MGWQEQSDKWTRQEKSCVIVKLDIPQINCDDWQIIRSMKLRLYAVVYQVREPIFQIIGEIICEAL